MSKPRLMFGLHQSANIADRSYDNFVYTTPQAVYTWVGNASLLWHMDNLHKDQPNCLITARLTDYEKFYKDRLTAGADGFKTGKDWALFHVRAGLPKYPLWRTDEWGIGHDQWKVDFNLGAIEVFHNAGYRMGAINYSEGNPRVIPYDGVNDWELWLPVLEKIDLYGPDEFVVTLNSYRVDGVDDAHLTRFHYLLDYCASKGLNNVLVALGETGIDDPMLRERGKNNKDREGNDISGDEWVLMHMREINQALGKYPKLYGGAWFTHDMPAVPDNYRMVTYHENGRDETVLLGFGALAKECELVLPIPGVPVPVPEPEPQPDPEPEPEPEPEPTPGKTVYINQFNTYQYTFAPDDTNGDRMVPVGLDFWVNPENKQGVSHAELYPPSHIAAAPEFYRLWNEGKVNAAVLVPWPNVAGKKYSFLALVTVQPEVAGDTVTIHLKAALDGGADPRAKTNAKATHKLGSGQHMISLDITAEGDWTTFFFQTISTSSARVNVDIDWIQIVELSDETPDPDPDPDIPEIGKYRATDVVFIRQGPGTEYEKVWELIPDETIFIYNKDYNGWAQLVERPFCPVAYINRNFIERVE